MKGWTYELVDLFPSDAAPIKLLKYSPDGRRIATGDVRRNVRVFEAGQMIYEQRFRSPWDRLRAMDQLRDLTFDAAGDGLILAWGNRLIAVDLQEKKDRIFFVRRPYFGFMITCPLAVAVAKSNELAVTYDDAVVELRALDSKDVKPIAKWSDNDAPTMLAFLPDGERLVGSERHFVCVWDAKLGTKLAKMNTDTVYALAVSPVDSAVALRLLRSVKLWDLDSGQLITEVPGVSGLPTVAISRDGSLFAVGDKEGVTVFDRAGHEVRRHETGPNNVLALAFSPTQDILAIGDSIGRISFLDYARSRACK